MKTIATTILLLLSCISYTQDEIVAFTVNIRNESDRPMKDVILNSYKGDTLFRSDTTRSNGKVYNIILPIGSTYRMVIGKEGYVSKMAAIDANFKSDLDVWTETPMKFEVTLFEECDAGDYEFMKTEPLITYQFDSTGFLTFDKAHLRKMIRKVEFAKYANLSEEDHETFSTAYFGGMEQMEFQDYDKGLEMLLKAKEIVDCQYVLDKIKECEDLKKTQDAYESAIYIADSLFNEGRYTPANTHYSIASKIKREERYPTEQMLECGYRKILAKANQYFDEKQYEKALNLYDRALSLKPSDTSFAEKHAKCQKKVK
jgi:tetratricopeptide (TPR) repeat protein